MATAEGKIIVQNKAGELKEQSQQDETIMEPVTENIGSTKAKIEEASIPKTATTQQSQESQTDPEDTETVEQLRTQLGVLMNQLTTLSVEKSKMEANFQIDRKQLRSERDECEKVIKDLKDRLKKAQNVNYSEIEHAKCKLIMERHEREKEHADFVRKMRELQKLLQEEQRGKEQLEGQLKTHLANKTQCKILEAELEITKTRLKQAEEAAKETPPLLLSLQAEMAVMKKQHLNAIREEQKRVAAAEQQARGLAMMHEARVAGLEARLAELSDIVGGYDRLRQQDQVAIQKLKDQLADLQDVEHETIVSNDQPDEIVSKIKGLYARLLDLDNKKKDVYVKSLLSSLSMRDEYPDYKEKYDALLQEFEDYKHHVMCKYNASSNLLRGAQQQQRQNLSLAHDKDHDKTQLNLLKVHNSNLEERIRMINNEMLNKERALQEQLEHHRKLYQEERVKLEHTLHQKDNEFRNRISALEQQLLRQRERSMALVEEKDKEILTLKTSFRALLPNRETAAAATENKTHLRYENNAVEPIADLVTGLLTNDSPPILHYTQELARKEVQMSSSRRKILELEAALREQQREMLHAREQQREETKTLKAHITRLEACKSREGANLEYLKNVFINYLTTNDASSKRHMLNAISTVLRFTSDELSKIRH